MRDRTRLKELSTQLARTGEQKRLKQKLEQDLHTIELELQEKSSRLTALNLQLDKEKVDVKKLEHASLTALFYSVLGSREEQLEKERQELLSAQLSYQQIKHQMEFLERERNSLLQQLDRFADVEAEYELLLSEKEHLLHKVDQAVASELVKNSEQIAKLASEVKEISEAIHAGNNVLSSLEQVIESLESAKSWGTWDILGGGLISTAVKHDRIDDARHGINDVQTKMSQFNKELVDVRKHVDLKIDIGEFEHFADFFFDGLIIDWVVQSKVAETLERTKNAKNMITQVVKELEGIKTQILERT